MEQITSSPLRILMVVTIMNRGGAETMLMNYLRNIDRSKLIFDFLAHRLQEGSYDKEIKSLGGIIHHLPALTWKNPWQYCRAIRAFLESHPEYQHIHIHSSGVALFVARAAHQLHRKVIIQHSHACALDSYTLTTPIRFLCKIAVRHYLTHFFACGKEAGRWLFGKHNLSRIYILPNAINAAQYRYRLLQRQKVRDKMGWDNKFIVGNVARFSPQKNHFRLIRIFKEVLKRKENAMLVLVGEKQGYYEQLVQEIHRLGLDQHVQFTGGRSDVADLLQGFDVVLFPSLYEGLSVAMIEQQAAGLKIVASSAIASEVAICPELVSFIDLSKQDTEWADELLKDYDRRDTYKDICRAGFDIHENARWLQEFYLTSSFTSK